MSFTASGGVPELLHILLSEMKDWILYQDLIK
mgnify:CR=1 FL=1